MADQPVSEIAQALGRIPSGLFVVSIRDESDGTEAAFVASWVMQAGFEPPALTVAVGEGRAGSELIVRAGGRFAVSVIGDDEKNKLGAYFRGVEPAPDALDALEVERTPAGLAVVPDCLAWLECRTLDTASSGDHRIVVGEVTAARAGKADAPAIHLRADGLKY